MPNIDPNKDFYRPHTWTWYLKGTVTLSDIILVGHYREENGYLISDPVLAMEGGKIWSPVRIELWCGDTICAFYKDEKRIKEFQAFQRMFARNIREQGWVENREKVNWK